MLLNWIIGASQVDFTTGQLALIINLGVFLLLLLAFLGGFWRGLFKSTFHIIATCGTVLLFFLVFPLISNALMKMDLSALNLSVGDGLTLTTIENTICSVLVDTLQVSVPEGVLLTETFIYQAIYSVIEMVLRIALLVVLLVLNMTVFRFIYWVIYFIVKPRPRDEFNQRIKLTKRNRLYGGLVGLFNFILILLVICVPLSGVFSIVETANEIAQVTPESDDERILVTYDGVQMNLSTNNRELLNKFGIDDLYIDFLEEFAPLYRKTIPGFIYSIPIGGTEIDTLIFDSLFKVQYEDQKLKMRKEIVTVMEVIKMVSERTNLNVDFNSLEGIALILDELTEQEINEIFEKLSSLDIIQFAIPLAADTASLMIKYGDETMKAYVDFVDLVELLKEQDYHGFIKNIGGVVGSVKGFLEDADVTVNELITGTVDYNKFLKCGKESVNNVLNNIASIELVDNLLSAAIKKAANLEDVQESLTSFMVLEPKVEISVNNKYIINGIESSVDVLTEDIDSLEFKIDFENNNFVIVYNEEEYDTNVNAEGSYYPVNFNEISFSHEIRNIGNIYNAFDALGIKSIEAIMKLFDSSVETEEEIDFDKFTFDNLNNLSSAILNSKIISSSTENVFVFVNNILPNEYHNMIVIPEKLNPEDLTSALIVGRVVLKENLLGGNLENIDYKEIISKNKDEFINAIKNSNIIMSNLTPVLKMVLGMTIGEDIIVIPDDVVWGDELGNLLDGIAEILNSDILGENFDIKKINVENLANSLSKSTVLTGSLNNIISYVIGLIEIEDFELTIPSDIVWDYNEIYSLLKSFSIVGSLYFDSIDSESGEMDVNILLNGICNLTDEDIKLIIGNKLISRTVSALLYNLSNSENGALKGVIEVNIPLEDEETWFGNENKKGELEILLSAAKHLINGLDLSDEENIVNNVLSNVSSLTDDQIEEIASSKILADTVKMYVESMNEEEEVLVIPEDLDWDLEISRVLKAFKVIINKVEIDFNNFDPNTLLDSVLEFGDEEVDLLLASKILYATVEKYLIDFDNEGVIVYKDITDLAKEFKALLKSVKLVFGNDFSFANMEFDVNEILGNITSLENSFGSTDDEVGVILESKILVDTIVMYIENINEGEEILVIPDGVVWADTNEPGELRNILLAVKVLFNGREIDFEQIDANIIIDLTDDDIDNVLKSVVIEATIKKILEDLNSDSLVVNPITDLNKELKALLKAVKLVLGEDVDLNNLDNIDVNEVLSNVVKLTNDINSSDDEVGQILNSNILTDTIVMYIEDFASGEDSVIKLPEDDFSWKDEGNTPGEIRNLLGALKVLFNGDVDLENIDANIIMDLSDSDVDTVLDSKILYATIKSILEDLNSDSLVVNPITDLNSELKALLKAVKLVLGEDVDLNNLEDIDVNEVLSNIVGLTNDINASGDEDEVGQILDSNILTDTIISFIEDFASEEDSVIKLPEDGFSWKDEGNTPGEIRNLLGALKVLFGEEVDLENIDANIIMDLSDSDVDTVLDSKILYATIKDIIESLDGDVLVVNPIADLNSELKALIKAVKLVLGEDIDLNNLEDIDVNEILSNIVGLTNDINASGDDDEVGQILDSNILTDTIISFIEDFASGEDSVIILPEDDFSWKDEGNTPGEIRNLLGALKVLFGEEVDLENIDANIIMDLSDSDVDTVLDSKILYATIKDIIESLDGDVLVVNPIADLNSELKALIKAVKLVLGEDIDLADMGEIDANEVLNNIVNLTNDINASGDDDEVGQILDSNILTDTIISFIEEFAYQDGSIIVMPEDGFSWKDEGNTPGEIRNLLGALNVLFGGDEIDLDSLDINIIMDLSDEEIDVVFSSVIFNGTIKNIIESLDGDALVVNPIEDVNKELKALIKAVKLVLGEDGDINDFASMDTNTLLSNIVGLTNNINASGDEDEVGQLLESNIICDTIEMFVMKLADEGTIIVPNEEDLQWRDYTLAGVKVPGELRNLLSALKVLFGEDEVDMNFDANIIMDLTDDDIDTVLESDILYLTIKDIIESLDGTLVVNPIVNLNKELKALIKSIKIILGPDADLANPEFEVDRILEISDDDMEIMLESNIVYDTFYEMIIDLTEGSLEDILVLKPGTDLDKEEMIKFVNSIKVVLDGGNLSTMESSSFNIDKFIDLTDDEIDTLLDSTLISYSAALQVDTVLYGDEAALGEFVIFESYYDSDRIEEIESDLGNIIKVIRDLKALGINYEEFTFESFENALTGPDSEGKDEMLADALVQSKIITNSLNNMMNIIFTEGIYAAFPDADVEVGEVVPVGSETLEDAWRREIIQLVVIIDALTLVENPDILDETPVGSSTVGIENARNIGKFLDACSDSQLLEPVIIGILDAYITCYVDFVDGDTINTMVQEEGSYELALAGAAKLIQMFM